MGGLAAAFSTRGGGEYGAGAGMLPLLDEIIKMHKGWPFIQGLGPLLHRS